MVEIFTNILKDLIFPKQCFQCQTWGNFICQLCSENLQSQPHQRCIACQKPSLGGWTHPKCNNRSTPDRLITIFDYHEKVVSKLINTAKLSLTPEIFTELSYAGCAKLQVQADEWLKFVLCPIPQTRSQTRWRGFNQSELISKVFSEEFSLAIDKVLHKSRSTRQQKILNKSQRQINLRNAFYVAEPEFVPAKIILLDDITTTGSTFLEATKILKQARVKTVWCIALAQD